jgi:FixJ family two-component response regulator
VIDTSSFVFIVDDDSSVRRSLNRLLRAAGFNVKTFESAQSFLDSFQDGEVACLVLDVRMPKMSGLALQKRLIESGSKVPIIFITAHEDSESREQAMNAGAIAFLRKPFEEQLLLEAISNAFEGGLA